MMLSTQEITILVDRTRGIYLNWVLEQFLSVAREPIVSLSTMEAKNSATIMVAQESTWLIQLMNDLYQQIDYAIPLYCNNQSAIRLVENPIFHAKTKHMEVHYHFVRKKCLAR